MFAFFRVLFFGALGLLFLVPLGILLAAIGFPVLLVCGVLALPLLVVLFLVGLPIFVVGIAAFALLAATFGVAMAFLAVGLVALKLAFVVLIPLLIVGWLFRRLFAPRHTSVTF